LVYYDPNSIPSPFSCPKELNPSARRQNNEIEKENGRKRAPKKGGRTSAPPLVRLPKTYTISTNITFSHAKETVTTKITRGLLKLAEFNIYCMQQQTN
jgi:hypothetical protein